MGQLDDVMTAGGPAGSAAEPASQLSAREVLRDVFSHHNNTKLTRRRQEELKANMIICGFTSRGNRST
jgi:hypothetical protein